VARALRPNLDPVHYWIRSPGAELREPSAPALEIIADRAAAFRHRNRAWPRAARRAASGPQAWRHSGVAS